jgi:hypothetical protein
VVIGGRAGVTVRKVFSSMVRDPTCRVSSVDHHRQLRRARIMDRAGVAEGWQHRTRRKEYGEDKSERTGNDTALHPSKNNT